MHFHNSAPPQHQYQPYYGSPHPHPQHKPPGGYASLYYGGPPPQPQSFHHRPHNPFHSHTPQSTPYTLLLARTSRRSSKRETLTSANMRNATPLFAIHHKGHSLSSEPTLKLVRSDGQQLGTANFHTFSTRIDLALGGNHGAAPPLLSYKPTQPLPPACTPPGQTWRWEVAAMGPKRAVARLIATPDSAGKRSSRWTGRKSKGKAPLGEVVAVVWLEDKLKSGRVEVHQPGLPQSLFELVVLSAVAQMAEMRRNVKEGKKQLSAEALGALGESVGNWGDASGGSGGDGGGGGGGDGGGGGGAV